MNSAPVFRISQLAISVSKTTVRHGSMMPRRRVPKPELSNFTPGHGEQIWVWSHLIHNQIVYSHTRAMDSNRALRQLPFIAKKSKPAKLRRDLWQPLALIQFPLGAGVVGQNVFQKLREFRRRHELEWDDEILYREEPKKYEASGVTRTVRTRINRGKAIHDQRANAIADMAAVLSGAGHGSRIWINAAEKEQLDKGDAELRGKRWTNFGPKKNEDDGRNLLCEATVYWLDQADQNYATKWSENVSHELLEETEEIVEMEGDEVVESAAVTEVKA